MKRHGFRVLFRLAWRTFFASRGTFARLTVRRGLFMAFWIPMMLGLQLTHHLAFLLDDLFFRGWRRVQVKRPLFIIGIPRSGTTFLHRLLSEDDENFTTLTTWEMVLAPSVIERKFWRGIGRIDRALGGWGRKLVGRIEDRAFASIRQIHKVGLFEPEEDDIVLFSIFASIFLIFPFPFSDEMMDLARFDEQLPAPEREAIMGFYRDCVQRHLYVHGVERRFLSKNPAFTAKIDSLVTTFPDCQIICNVRSPFQAIPSLLSFVTHSFDQFGNDHRGNEWYEFMYGIASYWYRWPLERIPEQDPQQARFLTYPALVGALEPTIQELYIWLDLEIGERWSHTLAREIVKAKAYKSTHAYDLATYGLTQARIYEDLHPVFERFGFDGIET